MEKMKISLSSITENGIEIDTSISGADLCPEGDNKLPLGDVAVCGHLFRVDDEYLFKGHIAGDYIHACDRCLEETQQSFRQEIFWSFEQGILKNPLEELADEDNESEDSVELDQARIFEGDEIDLAPHVWEEIVLSAPGKFLCRDDCAGLCAICGVNLNIKTCTCSDISEDIEEIRGLAALGDMFPDLKTDNSED